MIAVTARFAQARLGRWTVSHWVLRGVVLGLFVLWCGLALAQPAEKRVALETWGRVLTTILENKPASSVVPFSKGASA